MGLGENRRVICLMSVRLHHEWCRMLLASASVNWSREWASNWMWCWKQSRVCRCQINGWVTDIVTVIVVIIIIVVGAMLLGGLVLGGVLVVVVFGAFVVVGMGFVAAIIIIIVVIVIAALVAASNQNFGF